FQGGGRLDDPFTLRSVQEGLGLVDDGVRGIRETLALGFDLGLAAAVQRGQVLLERRAGRAELRGHGLEALDAVRRLAFQSRLLVSEIRTALFERGLD